MRRMIRAILGEIVIDLHPHPDARAVADTDMARAGKTSSRRMAPGWVRIRLAMVLVPTGCQ